MAANIRRTNVNERGRGLYVCEICDYVYNPAAGDPASNIFPGTPFEQLPEDWVCPICGFGKECFHKAL